MAYRDSFNGNRTGSNTVSGAVLASSAAAGIGTFGSVFWNFVETPPIVWDIMAYRDSFNGNRTGSNTVSGDVLASSAAAGIGAFGSVFWTFVEIPPIVWDIISTMVFRISRRIRWC